MSGTLHGRFGDQTFDVPVALDASASKTVVHSLTLRNPKLWWPTGYGDPNLYGVELAFGDSDALRFQAGVRQFTYSEEGGALKIWINGRRFIPRRQIVARGARAPRGEAGEPAGGARPHGIEEGVRGGGVIVRK